MDTETKKLDSEIISAIKGPGLTDKAFQALALKIFAYQFQRNANYQKFCLIEDKRPGTVKNWKEIPALPTFGFKELVLAVFPVKNAVKVFKTSGTTRQNRGVHFFDTLKLYETAILPPFKEYLLPDDGELSYYFLISSPKDSPDSSLSHMMGVVNRVFAKEKGRFYVREDNSLYEKLYADLRSEKKKIFILSTAFSLKGFLDFLKHKKANLKLPKGSRLMETGGFKGKTKEISKHALYKACEKQLGIPKDHCVSEYGMTELSSQFYDTTFYDKVNGLRRRSFKTGPAWMRTLVIDPKTGHEAKKGKIGALRHFDLANRGSVIAVQTEDLGRQIGEGFELLGRASGAELRGCSLNYEKFLSS